MNKLVRDGKVAVLFSPGYGAGWSTWNKEYPEMVFDPEIAEIVMRARKSFGAYDEDRHLPDGVVVEIEGMATSKYPDAYLGGAEDLQVAWVEQGAAFDIDEYDGYESIRVGSRSQIA